MSYQKPFDPALSQRIDRALAGYECDDSHRWRWLLILRRLQHRAPQSRIRARRRAA